MRTTISLDEWNALLDVLRDNQAARWRFTGDDDYILEGRVTHVPAGPPSAWPAHSCLFIGDGRVGEPFRLDLIRQIQRI